jgi:hypothetical protein
MTVAVFGGNSCRRAVTKNVRTANAVKAFEADPSLLKGFGMTVVFAVGGRAEVVR